MKKIDTICKYPFNSIAIKDYSSNGKLNMFWPCCMMGNQTLEEVATGKLNKNKLPPLPGEDIGDYTPEQCFNHPRMDNLRKNLSNGIRDKACTVCWEMEDRGIQSFRQRSFGRENADDVDKIVKLEIIDMSINNKCNLRCRMCSPTASSALAIDHKYFEDNKLIDDLRRSAVRWGPASMGAFKLSTNKQWQWIINNTDKFKRLRLSGGEPFDNEDVLAFIDTAIANGNSKDITLEFHTNATLLTDQLIEKLSHFDNNLNFSIDGTGKVYEFIRYPANWNELDRNMRAFIKAIPQRFINLAFIMMITNVFNIPEYIAWANSLKTGEHHPGVDGISLSYAEVHSQDRGISLRSLSVDLLEEAYAEIEEAGKRYPRIQVNDALSIIKDSIVNNDENKQKTLLELELFDKARNQNFRDYLDPRIIKWLEG